MGKFLTPILSLLLVSISTFASADEYQTTLQNFKQSHETKRFFNSAYGYVVFPTIGKGGLGLGAAFGKGQVKQVLVNYRLAFKQAGKPTAKSFS